ncbi:MAG: MFS transporter [Lachnospiraceae bacterium]
MNKFKVTITSCFVGYIVQAIINNFIPLLFLTFESSYGISLSKITLLITINFAVQLVVDVLAMFFVDKIGYRVSIVLAHIFSATGLIFLAILPDIMKNPGNGLLIAVVTYAVGGGIIEVLISPIMESCPTDHKEKAMSLLHSFYCWGHVAVVLISTIFFGIFGIFNWKILAFFWAVIPIVNGIAFMKVPMNPLIEEHEVGMPIKTLLCNKVFWILMLMMICAGASELSVSQWASAFAEQGLGISKTLGDLTGPMMFAICMGISRVYYGKVGEKINLDRFMKVSVVLCIASYFIISLIPNPIISLVGCAICGFSVGIMWPGTFSNATISLKNGGTAMFALLALAGDVGCSVGPTVVGMASAFANSNLKIGILIAVVFPIILLSCLWLKEKYKNI